MTEATIHPVEWKEQQINIGSLKGYDRNPRSISVEAYERLKHKLQTQGYCDRISVDYDLTIIGGHQRLRALKELGHKIIKVLMPDRKLTKKEFNDRLLSSNISEGKYDMDILTADFDPIELQDIGIDMSWLVDDELKAKVEPKPKGEMVEDSIDERGLCGTCPFRDNIL